MTMPTESPVSMDDVLRRVRPAVRAERAYHVGTAPDTRVKLNQNECPYDLPASVKAELVEAFLAIPFNRYPTEQPDDLVAAISDRTGHPADGILVGNGSNELSYTLGLALVSDGTPVVLARPMFALFASMARIYGGHPVEVPCLPDWQFDVDGLVRERAHHDPALTVVASPNNPTGLALPTDAIERIVVAAPGVVLVDEAYVEFNPYGSALPLVARHPNVVVMRTMSKACGLAGLRIGYLMMRPELASELLKARVPFMVDPLAEAAARTLLAHDDIVAHRVDVLRRGTETLTRGLQATGRFDVIPSQANFVIFRPRPPLPELIERLGSAGVLVRDVGGYPELTGFLRVSSGTTDENRDFLAALNAVLDSEA